MGLVNNHDFLGSAESACLENATPNQITGLYPKSRGSPGCSEVVATCSRGSEKTVNLVGQGKAYQDSAKSLSLGNR